VRGDVEVRWNQEWDKGGKPKRSIWSWYAYNNSTKSSSPRPSVWPKPTHTREYKSQHPHRAVFQILTQQPLPHFWSNFRGDESFDDINDIYGAGGIDVKSSSTINPNSCVGSDGGDKSEICPEGKRKTKAWNVAEFLSRWWRCIARGRGRGGYRELIRFLGVHPWWRVYRQDERHGVVFCFFVFLFLFFFCSFFFILVFSFVLFSPISTNQEKLHTDALYSSFRTKR